MNEDLIARASTTIDAPAEKIWEALTDPAVIKQYMFGTTVESDFKKGSPISWKGEWQGNKYEDHGTILDFDPPRLLRYSHINGSNGETHNVTIELSPNGSQTEAALSQDGNASEEAREHSAKNWEMMLGGLKKVVEG